ncbi:hypothetical protein CYG49_01955 [Candidatus Saccharibacteria bacterium]|nr:MAG: hypothetical protein CYG49_01955 [Candidatus Saccharibacteria bacterium]
MQHETKRVNLVLEGGGIKGIALVGAVNTLQQQGYQFERLAGTSAGAVVASLVAAGMPTQQLATIVKTFDFPTLADEGFLDSFGLIGKSLSVLFERGIFEGKVLHDWLEQQLAALGVRTFADLKIDEPWAADLPPEQRYKLVVLAADVTRGTLVRFPWDYHLYGLDPDKQSVADAVRASASIPFFFEPVTLGESFIVDGGIISNFPVWIFEQSNERHATDIPTFGVKLSARPENKTTLARNDTSNTFSYAFSIISTMLDNQDHEHINDPCTQKRTIFIDTESIRATDFQLTPETKEALLQGGERAAAKFISTWNFSAFLRQCQQ